MALWCIGGLLGCVGSVGGHYGDIRGHQGVSGMYWGAGRDSRYSGARRGIEGIRGYWGLLGCVQGIGGHYVGH